MAGGKIIYNVINKADFKNNPALVLTSNDARRASRQPQSTSLRNANWRGRHKDLEKAERADLEKTCCQWNNTVMYIPKYFTVLQYHFIFLIFVIDSLSRDKIQLI
jgi:hypothetical protein